MAYAKRLAFVMFAAASSQTQAAFDTCESTGTCAAEDNIDEFATLQKKSQKQAGRVEVDEQPEWRDSIEAEKAFFSKATPEMIEWKKMQWWQYCQKTFAENVQAPPQPPPYGPWQREGEFVKPTENPRPLKHMPELRSSNGVLNVTLVVDTAWLEVPGTGIRLKARVYNGSYPAPTIRIKRGDRLNVRVINRLGKDHSDEQMWPRREGQATYEFPNGVPKDNARYQDVGQNPGDPLKMKGTTNNMHQPNTTNLHTHGFHVSQREPQDNVLDVGIGPGEEYTYSYELSPYHSAGNSWYHPHWHGSVTLQVTGGMVGAIIIDESPGEAPDWIHNAREETLLIHEATWGGYFGPSWLPFAPEDPEQGCFPFGSKFTINCALGHRMALMANMSGDMMYRMEYAKGWGYEVNETTPISDFFTVNGQYAPTMTIKAGEWVRMRVIFAAGNLPINPIINGDNKKIVDGCEMYLISKDNAWLHKIPRRIVNGLFMGAGNRAQIMVRCKKAGNVRFQNNNTAYAFNLVQPNQTFFHIKITGPDVKKWSTPKEHITAKPRYLNDLTKLPDSMIVMPDVINATNQFNGKPLDLPKDWPMINGKTISQLMDYDFLNGASGRFPIPTTSFQNQPVRFGIQNMTFSHTRPMASFPVASVVELMVGGVDTHSWHMHTHPVQYTEFPDDPDFLTRWGGYFHIGDWQDVLQLPDPSYDVKGPSDRRVKVRFQTDCYTGPLVIHCHILYHEDLGMMTFFNTTGKEYTFNPHFKNQGIYASPPEQCTKDGQMCAPPTCTDYTYGTQGGGGGKGGSR